MRTEGFKTGTSKAVSVEYKGTKYKLPKSQEERYAIKVARTDLNGRLGKRFPGRPLTTMKNGGRAIA